MSPDARNAALTRRHLEEVVDVPALVALLAAALKNYQRGGISQ